MAQEISHFSKDFINLTPPVTCKIRSRSLKSNQYLGWSYYAISMHASLEKIHPPFQKIFYLQDYNLEKEN